MTKTLDPVTPALVWALAAATIPLGTAAETATIEENHGIRVLAEPSPRFPQSLWRQGVISGHATLAVTVDANGRLEDWLVIEATHVNLTLAIEEVIDEWSFEAAVVEGTPLYATQCLPIFFDASAIRRPREAAGNPLFNVSRHSQLRAHSFDRRRDAKLLRFATPAELDQFPEPLTQPGPEFSVDAYRESLGGRASFKFYIDTKGYARMPTLYKLYGDVAPEALLASQEAIKHWRFKPLTSNGESVVTEVIQTFEFSSLGEIE